MDNNTLTLPQQQIALHLKQARDKKNSDALNVIISVGLLTKDSPEFYFSKPRISGERKQNVFRVWNRTSNQVFQAEIVDNTVLTVIFVRGEWENQLEGLAHNGTKEIKTLPKSRKPALKLRERTD